MSSSLVTEIRRYCNHLKRLQTILEETKRNFEEINENSRNESDKIAEFELLQEEEAEVLSTANKLPGIVVLGQNEFCKAQLVNEIFKRTIFPSFERMDDKNCYRTVRFKYGDNLCINLELPGDFSLAENLEAYNGPWSTIPHKDLEISPTEITDSAVTVATLEVSFNHQLLRNGCTLVVAASNTSFENEIKKCIKNISPIFLYGFQMESLSTKEIQDLEILKEVTNFQPVCFVRVINSEHLIQITPGNPFSVGTVQSPSIKSVGTAQSPSIKSALAGVYIKQDLDRNGNVHHRNRDTECNNSRPVNGHDNESDSTVQVEVGSMDDDTKVSLRQYSKGGESSHSHRMGKVYVTSVPPTICNTIFKELCKIGYLTDMPGVRNINHDFVQDYYEVDSILVADFDQFIPSFTRFSEQTMQRYLVNAVTVLNNAHVRCLRSFIIYAFDMAREILITPKKIEFAREKEEELYKSLLQIAVDKGDEIRQMIEKTIVESREALLDKAFQYDFIGVDFSDTREILTPKGLKICTGQIQELVLGSLNQVIASKLVSSVDVLRDSYTGTLTRCLESLENVEHDNADNNSTTEALKQILNTAYQVEITVRSSSTIIHFLLQRMKQLVQALPWSQTPKIDDEWKKAVASDMLASLSATRLSKSMSSQIKDRLKKSHEAFSVALKQLQIKHTGRLDKIEDGRVKLRKIHAPRVAKVALESMSLKDLILYGMPHYGKEIGRGQYGIVYTCDTWKGRSPCAIKSVVPPDDKHWNDLALEFFYTKNIPEHERIVMLHGSVIDYTYDGGTNPAVLLVMDRLQRDLYVAIKQKLDWVSRLQVSIDVVEGIRFLHSQGLVHRDIKLKNVLLDKSNRGKLTDLGFCKPEVMMSGSIVGTPIHMAPELFTGNYDGSVDVYAFGILFWYVCAGSIKLPQNFEQCANKDMLWTSVKKGLRPETLPVFDGDCWELMSECWDGEPSKRPLLGDVQQRLSNIYESYLNRLREPIRTANETPHKLNLRIGEN